QSGGLPRRMSEGQRRGPVQPAADAAINDDRAPAPGRRYGGAESHRCRSRSWAGYSDAALGGQGTAGGTGPPACPHPAGGMVRIQASIASGSWTVICEKNIWRCICRANGRRVRSTPSVSARRSSASVQAPTPAVLCAVMFLVVAEPLGDLKT